MKVINASTSVHIHCTTLFPVLTVNADAAVLLFASSQSEIVHLELVDFQP